LSFGYKILDTGYWLLVAGYWLLDGVSSSGGIIFSVILKINFLSQAFVKENEEQWLHEVSPTMNALIVYLTRENNGVRVYEKKTVVDKKSGKEVHEMSNGLSYSKDEDGKWFVV
jgi:hypothetical protein